MNWITKRPHDAATLAWIDREIKRPVGTRRQFTYSQVGTIAGQQSVAEARDYAKHVDDLIALTKQTFDSSDWFTKDPHAASQWVVDYVALTRRVNDARGSMAWKMANQIPSFLAKYSPGQPAFDAIAHAVQQVPLTRTKGDLNDLISRLNVIKNVPEGTLPQPRQDIDTDLGIYGAANTAIKAMPWEKKGEPTPTSCRTSLAALFLSVLRRWQVS